MSSRIESHNLKYGDDIGNWSYAKIFKSFIGYHLVYPLHLVAIIYFIKAPSSGWVLAYILAYFAYYALAMPFYYFYSFKQMNAFYKTFEGPNRKYQLQSLPELEKSIFERPDFNSIRSKMKMAIRQDFPERTKEILGQPIRVFTVEALTEERLGECKAYCDLTGKFFIVIRTGDVDQNPFEKFLYLHELEHINDRGILNLRALIRMKLILPLHIIVFFLVIQGGIEYFFLAVYAILMLGERFGRFQTTRELIADNRSLLQLTKDERAFVVKCLEILWGRQMDQEKRKGKSDSLTKYLNAQSRLDHVEMIKLDGLLEREPVDLSKQEDAEKSTSSTSASPMRTLYMMNSFTVRLVTILMFLFAFRWEVNYSPFWVNTVLAASILLSLLLVLFLSQISFRKYHKMYDELDLQGLKGYPLINLLELEDQK